MLSISSAWRRVRSEWKSAWSRTLVINIIIITVVSTVMLLYVPDYFKFVENRKGKLLTDPLLQMLPGRDMSWFIFPIIYISLLLTVINLSVHPRHFIMALQIYLLVTLMRLTCIYLISLEPPEGLVMLIDPVNEKFFYGNRNVTKDLFFSGHTAAQFILVMVVKNRMLKRLFLILAFVLAVLLMIQHVHYTMDILAAPLFVWLGQKIIVSIHTKLGWLKKASNQNASVTIR